MPEAYELHDAQFLQYPFATAGAGALSVSLGVVPAGKVWTILSALAYCSVAETQVYWFSIFRNAIYYPVTAPVSVSVDPATNRWLPMLTEGMELKVFAGEELVVFRAAATAGSTIGLYSRIIENDIPFYQEVERHAQKLRSRAMLAWTDPFRRAGGGGVGRGIDRVTRDRPTRE